MAGHHPAATTTPPVAVGCWQSRVWTRHGTSRGGVLVLTPTTFLLASPVSPLLCRATVSQRPIMPLLSCMSASRNGRRGAGVIWRMRCRRTLSAPASHAADFSSSPAGEGRAIKSAALLLFRSPPIRANRKKGAPHPAECPPSTLMPRHLHPSPTLTCAVRWVESGFALPPRQS